MPYDDVQQAEATQDVPATEADAVIEGADEEVAGTVDALAAESLRDPSRSPQPEGVEGDPIGDAEEHIASLDMAEERRKLADLQRKL